MLRLLQLEAPHMGRSTTLARLTLETAITHAPIDEALLGSLEFLTTSGYRRFLCMLYGFQAPLEAALAMTPDIDLDFIAERVKAARIAGDLMSLGLTRREFQLLSRRQTIGPFKTSAEALGWMYSTERLMLQVEALRVRLENEMPVVFTLASQFLCSYQHVADIRWRQYGVLLDRCGRVYGIDPIIASAKTALDALQRWLADSAANVPNRAQTSDERASA